MKKYRLVLLFAYLGTSTFMTAQEMNPKNLSRIISKVSDTAITTGNTIRFAYKERPLICVYDENANRMRIISPIVETKDLEEKHLLNALVANFHSALDVKYALSDEVMWAVFIHPLQELSEHQVIEAIRQVHTASVTFGSTYSSTNLVFPGNTKKIDSIQPKKLINRG